MTRREKIIVAAMSATIALGSYLYFPIITSDGTNSHPDGTRPTLAYAETIAQNLNADKTLSKDLFTLRRAEQHWESDPFIKSDISLTDTLMEKPTASVDSPTATSAHLKYTGYLEAGMHRLAIINGMEYEQGESINRKGYYVRRIHPRQVEIGKRNAPDVILLKLQDHENISGDKDR
jgi:hypothetical protein